eukprot:261004_1
MPSDAASHRILVKPPETTILGVQNVVVNNAAVLEPDILKVPGDFVLLCDALRKHGHLCEPCLHIVQVFDELAAEDDLKDQLMRHGMIAAVVGGLSNSPWKDERKNQKKISDAHYFGLELLETCAREASKPEFGASETAKATGQSVFWIEGGGQQIPISLRECYKEREDLVDR